MSNPLEWDDFQEKLASYAGLEKGDIRPEMNIYKDLGMDSLGLFSLGMFLMNTYKVKVPVSAVATIETVGHIFDLMSTGKRM